MIKMTELGALHFRSSISRDFLAKAKFHHTNNGIQVEDMDLNELKSNYPWINPSDFGAAKRCDHVDFGSSIGELEGGMFFPMGYVSDPQRATANLVYSAQEKGAVFQWRTSAVDIFRNTNGSVAGIKLSDGSSVSTPIVVNC